MSIRNGMVPYEDRSLVTFDGGYFLLAYGDEETPEEKGIIRIDDHYMEGKPTIYGDTMYVSLRMTGIVNEVDISDIENPKLIRNATISGNPGLVIKHRGRVLIPGGYQGLLVWK